ncbi:MAG: hypothetical protein DME86_02700 [Verrucomicrobia bacterium]|nr:MAG: hypothetical protein DME86_02700 [Verrucomicrobiota bacterium]
MDEFNDDEIGRLLRLKKFEQPLPGYFENFLHEFHRRQRDELLRQPLWKIAVERAQDFMLRLNVARLASYPVAAAAVLVCAAVLSLKIYQTPQAPSVAQIQSTVPVQSDWNLASQVSGVMATQPRPVFNANLSTHRKTAPPRYVLDSMPVSYESTLRF